jgi:hypothetical protein
VEEVLMVEDAVYGAEPGAEAESGAGDERRAGDGPWHADRC